MSCLTTDVQNVLLHLNWLTTLVSSRTARDITIMDVTLVNVVSSSLKINSVNHTKMDASNTRELSALNACLTINCEEVSA